MRAPLIAVWLAVATLGAAGQTLSTQPPPTQTPAPVAPPPTGSLAGRITSQPDGKPLARARVVVTANEIFECPPRTPVGKTDNCPRYNRIATTDADGRYTVDKLPQGKTYVTTASKTGFATRAFGETALAAPPATVELTDGQKKTDVDIRLTPQIFITGTLLDEDNTPFSGALVEALPAAGFDGSKTPDATSQSISDDHGQFRLYGLAAGNYMIRAFDPAYQLAGDAAASLEYPPTYFPGTTSQAEAGRVTVTAGAPREALRFALQLGTPVRTPRTQVTKPAGPAPTASLSGRITSMPDGKPIAGARIRVSADELSECAAPALPGGWQNCVPFFRVAKTDKEGRYTVEELPQSKTYVVVAARSGFSARAFGETPPHVPPSFVTLTDAEKRESVDIALVRDNVIGGSLLDEDETPFAGALVEALRAVYTDGKRSFVSAAESVTDDHGRFRLFGLAPGQYYVTAFDPAYTHVGDELGQLVYGPTYYQSTVYQDDAVRITLDPGMPREGLQFKLRIIRPARLTGKLTASGLQMLGGSVNIGPSRSVRSGSFATSEADIKPDGVFQFANILAERYVIRARAEVERNGLTHFALWTQPISGNDVTEVEMVLSPGALVNGRIKWSSKTSPGPVDQSAIRIRSPMSDGSLFGDTPSGEITLDRLFTLKGVMAGGHLIRVENLPEPWRLQKVLYHGAEVTDVPIDMEYKETYDGIEVVLTDVFTTLSGNVEIAPGDLPQGYAVIAFPTNRLKWQPNSRYIKLTYLDDRGRYSIRGLPPAEYYVAITRAADQSDLASEFLLDKLAQDAATIRLGEGDRRVLPLRAIIAKH